MRPSASAPGLAASGKLSYEAIGRGLETLGVFARFCRANHLDAEDVHVVATSAIRDAANGERFLADAQAATGLTIETLSAQDEAYYGYVAAVNTTTLTDGVVLDIGGGSMQLTHVEGRHARESASFPLGAVRVTEQFLPGDGPVKKKDLARLRDHVAETVSGLDWLASSGKRMVGIGGAVRNLAAAAQAANGSLDLGVQGFLITPKVLSDLTDRAGLDVGAGARHGPRDQARPRRHHPRRRPSCWTPSSASAASTGSRPPRPACARACSWPAPCSTGDPPLFDDVRGAAVRNLAIQYESDIAHVEHVAKLSLQMFDSLVSGGLFKPAEGERELLWAASMLHDVGMTISYDDHHKHSRYLIESAELPGFDPRERALIAQITRYHRKGIPKLGIIEAIAHDGDEELLDRCAVILRLAEHLERGRDQSVSEARLRHQRRRRRPAPQGRRRSHAAALERGALRRRRGV